MYRRHMSITQLAAGKVKQRYYVFKCHRAVRARLESDFVALT